MSRAASARENLARKFLGHDVFISYSRADGAEYATHLADGLTERKLSCLFDQWGTKPGKEIPAELLLALRRSSMLVVVGSAGATSSTAVEQEIREFLPTGRDIIPIDVDGSIHSARWWPLVEGLPIARETGRQDAPSETTVNRIVASVRFRRRNARLARYAIAALITFAVLAVLALAAGRSAATAIRSTKEAKAQQARAESQADRAMADAAREKELAAKARQDRGEAEEKRGEAERKQAEAQAQLEATSSQLTETRAEAEAQEYKQLLRNAEEYLREGRLEVACQRLDQAPLAPRNWEWGYYRAYCERDLLTLASRDERVDLPGRSMYLAFSHDGTLTIRDSKTGQSVRRIGLLRSCSTSTPWVTDLPKTATTQDGLLAARALPSGSIHLFKKNSGAPFLTIPAHREPVAEVRFSPDGTLLVSRCGFDQLPPDKSVPDDYTVRVWEIPSGRRVATLEEGRLSVDLTLFSPDSRRVLTSTIDRIVRLWDARTGALIARFAGHQYGVREAAFSQDGLLILTASGSKGTVRVWANRADQEVFEISPRTADENQFDIEDIKLPGKSIDIEKNVLTILDYDLPRPYVLKEFKGHSKDITHAQFSQDGRILLTVSLDHTARVWDVASGRFSVIPVGGYKNAGDVRGGHSQDLLAAVLFDDNKRLLTAAEDGFLKVWDVKAGHCLWTIDWIGKERRKAEKRRYQTRIFRLSRDRELIAIQPFWDAGEPMKIWDLTTGKLVSSLRAPGRDLKTARFSPDGTRLVTVTGSIMERAYETPLSWTALVWDVQRAEIVATLRMDGSKYVESGEHDFDGRDEADPVLNLVDGSVKLDSYMKTEIREAFVSGQFEDADFDAEGQSIFAILTRGRSSYRIWTWTGLPPRLRTMSPVDFARGVRAWKLKRLLDYLDRGAPELGSTLPSRSR